MDNASNRKYRGREFGVNIGTCVSAETFHQIEKLIGVIGPTKADVVRRLLLRGLVEYVHEPHSQPHPLASKVARPALSVTLPPE